MCFLVTEHPGSGGLSGGSGHSRKEKGHKTTRVRTVLNEKQLHTLRTCYGANPRPDALMKEQLVEMTGLSPRVIRVGSQGQPASPPGRLLTTLTADQPTALATYPDHPVA